MILDGVHIVPGYYELVYTDAILFHFVLYVDDLEQHKGHFYARSLGTQRAAERYIERIDRIRRIQDFILERAKAYGIPTIENSNLETTTETIMGVITDRLKEELES
jgi:2-phosphoglycerate kinase